MREENRYYPEKSSEDIFPTKENNNLTVGKIQELNNLREEWSGFPILDLHNLHANIENYLNNFHQMIDNVFKVHGSSLLDNVSQSKFYPAARQWRSETDHIIDIEVPGMDKKDISVSVSEKSIVINGEKKNETKQDDSQSTVYYGKFHREFSIPKDVDIEKASSSLEKGVLTIKFPIKEREGPKTRKLEIK